MFPKNIQTALDRQSMMDLFRYFESVGGHAMAGAMKQPPPGP